jgi:hypothetical protein
MSKKSNKLEQAQETQINQIDRLNEGLFSSLMRRILTRNFEKAVSLAYNDPNVRAAYDKFDASTEELLNTMKGTTPLMTHLNSPEFRKQTAKPGKARSRALVDAMKQMGFDI